MNYTVILDLMSIFFFLVTAIILVSNWRRIRIRVNEFVPLLCSILLYVFVSISNFLENLGITAKFDPAEDIAEIIFPLVFIFFANNWRQKINMMELQQQETWLRVTLESMADGVMTTDRHGKVLQLNKVMENLTGWKRNEARGMNANEILHFLDRKTAVSINLNPFQEVLNSSQDSRIPGGIILRGKDGRTTSISENTTAILSQNNNLLGAVGIFRDMTEYDLMSEQLTHIHKMEAIGQLAGGVAHDLNNMLAGIMGAADLLEVQMNSDEKIKYGNLVKLILKATERASELTTNMLSFSRKGKILSTPILLQDVLESTLAIAERTINKKVHLELQIPTEPLKVIGDPSQLQNCFLNLVINARDALPEGGLIRISAQLEHLDQKWCDNCSIKIEPGDYVCVEVQDDGIGISEEMQKKIFEPFFTTKPDGKGTGLGLAAVYGTVISHHGAITLRSQPGQGSVFSIFLPSTPLEIDEASQKQLGHQYERGEGTILVIEDESAVRITAQMILEQFGYTTMAAPSGRDGVDIYRQHFKEISAVLLDMVMPVMDGNDVFKELKKLNPEVKVIMYSGFPKNEKIPSDIAGFLKKPFRKEDLIEIIRKVLVPGV